MKMKIALLVSGIFGFFCSAYAGTVEKRVSYSDSETEYEGVLVYDESLKGPAPAILMVPNWKGVTDAAVEKATKLAGDKYVYFVADMYGADVRPKTGKEAGAAAGFVRGNRPLMRQRAQLALDTFLAQDAPMDKEKTAAIGFCFGGGTVLEFARGGADVGAVVSFHGDLLSPTLEADAAQTKAKVLVLHGADDPFVPQDHVVKFTDTMLQTDVDWQFVQFSGTVHSFTDPYANRAGKAEYNAKSAARAFLHCEQLFDEIF